jgi:fructoselysine-6-P-deglycase FrlB-like protein
VSLMLEEIAEQPSALAKTIQEERGKVADWMKFCKACRGDDSSLS